MREESNKRFVVVSSQLSKTFFLLCTLYLILTSVLFSQTISSSLNRNKILIGEQVNLQLKADVSEATYSLVSWFNFPDTINHLEVISRSKIDTIETNGSLSFLQTITITSFDSGLWYLPKLKIILQNKAGKQISFIADTTNTLQVIPVDVSGMKDYHDIKTVIDVEAEDNTWIYASIIIAAIIILGIITWLFLRKRKKKPVVQKKSAIIGSPLEWAMRQLDLLQKENYPSKNETKLFYTRLDEIYRTYFDEKIHSETMHMTTDEIMIHLKIYFSKEEIRTKFYQTMRLSQVVKFAKYIPEKGQNNEALQTTRDAINYFDAELSKMKTQNAY